MFFVLSKILSFLLMPLTWIALCLILSFFLRRWAKRLRLASVIILLFFSNSFILHEVNLMWETPITLDEDLGKYETAVVLGGYAYYSIPDDRITFRESSDRLMQGLRLLETGLVKRIVLSGGSGYILYPELREAEFVGSYLKEINIPSEKVLLESESRNTHENAVNTLALLQERGYDKQTIVLITSAFHMKRAKACFEKQGFKVVAYSADSMTGERIFTLDHLFLPSAAVLAHWNVLIHEWVGYVSYWIAGYV